MIKAEKKSTIHILEIKLFSLLKNKLGETEAEAVTKYVRQETENSNKKAVELINKDISNFRDHVDEKFSTQEQLMAFKIEQLRSDTYKVVFWSSLVQILTIIGGIVALYKIFKP